MTLWQSYFAILVTVSDMFPHVNFPVLFVHFVCLYMCTVHGRWYKLTFRQYELDDKITETKKKEEKKNKNGTRV